MVTSIRSIVAATALSACLAQGATAASLIVESISLGDVTYGDTPTTVGFTATTSSAVNAIGLTGDWSSVETGGGGSFPWLLDTTVTVNTPGGAPFTWGPLIGGDSTIAGYPVADFSSNGLNVTSGAGVWSLDFFNTPQAGGVSRISGAVVHLMREVTAQTFSYTAQPTSSNTWNRPFFIEGVSGIGPVSFDVLEFQVSESGGYQLRSDLSSESDTFTFLYKDSFDPNDPLANLLDYGLGNGNSPLGAERGSSEIDSLLFEGERYFWVTSTFARTSPLDPSFNVITGPGIVTVIPAPGVLAALGVSGLLTRRRRRADS